MHRDVPVISFGPEYIFTPENQRVLFILLCDCAMPSRLCSNEVSALTVKASEFSYLYGSGDEGNLCSRVQILVDDQPAGPLACPLHPAALDQHQQL